MGLGLGHADTGLLGVPSGPPPGKAGASGSVAPGAAGCSAGADARWWPPRDRPARQPPGGGLMGEPTGERPWSEATVETNEVRSAAASILSNWGEEANLLALFGAEVGALNGWTGRSSITRSGANRSAAEPRSGSRPGGRRVGLGVLSEPRATPREEPVAEQHWKQWAHCMQPAPLRQHLPVHALRAVPAAVRARFASGCRPGKKTLVLITYDFLENCAILHGARRDFGAQVARIDCKPCAIIAGSR